MAVGTFNSLMFGGIDSASYGIYIGGDSVFDAPARVVEAVSVPGRNGDVIIDQGRYENIKVEYPAGTFGEDQADFRLKLRQFINALKSQMGYQRLSDTYHPDEYRMGIFIDAVEVDPVHINTAGQFKLVFYCKPQRFLISGETKTEVASGNDIVNPTLFDAKPLIIAEGTGKINIGGHPISIVNMPLGKVTLAKAEAYAVGTSRTVTFNGGLLSSGDVIKPAATLRLDFTSQYEEMSSIDPDVNSHREDPTSKFVIDLDAYGWDESSAVSRGYKRAYLTYIWKNLSFTKGTASTVTESSKYYFKYWDSSVDYEGTVNGTASYDGNSTITFSHTITNITADGPTISKQGYSTKNTTAVSTRLSIIDPIHIDLEIGEAYIDVSGSIVSVNDSVCLGGSLPVLPPGSTSITYDNTITAFNVVPRWWQI